MSNIKTEYMEDELVIPKKSSIYLIVKRFLDILFSLIVLIICLPIFLIVALLIKIDSKGPVFYKIKRSQNKKRMGG